MRRKQEITITDEGRDKSKVFILKEMPASQGEAWATQVLLLLSRSGAPVEIPDPGTGFAGLAVVGLGALGLINYREVQPLLEEMFGFITIRPDAKIVAVERSLIEEDIEEIRTRVFLRRALLDLHLDPSTPASRESGPISTRGKVQNLSPTATPPTPSAS